MPIPPAWSSSSWTVHPAPERQRGAGFTLIELVVVISIIAVLSSLLGIGGGYYLKRARVERARLLVTQVATAIENYGARTWTWYDPALKTLRTWPLWDMDGNGVLDGTLDPGAFASARGASLPANFEYAGFVMQTAYPAKRKDLNADGELLDPWGSPLCIDLAANTLSPSSFKARFGGGVWFAVWSKGPDALDARHANDPESFASDPLNADNVNSWGMRNDR